MTGTAVRRAQRLEARLVRRSSELRLRRGGQQCRPPHRRRMRARTVACGAMRMESSGEKPTSMQTAASRADHAALLQQISAGGLGRSTNDSSAPLVFRVHAKDGAVEYSVASGVKTESQQLEWVMGAGVLGQTFVYQHNDRWYQSRMSVYTKAPQLDVTTGLKSRSRCRPGRGVGAVNDAGGTPALLQRPHVARNDFARLQSPARGDGPRL